MKRHLLVAGIALLVGIVLGSFFMPITGARTRGVAELSFRYKVEQFDPIDAPTAWLVHYAQDVAVLKRVEGVDGAESDGYEILSRFVAEVSENGILSLGTSASGWIPLWDEKYQGEVSFCRYYADTWEGKCLKEAKLLKTVTWNDPVFRNGARVTDLQTGQIVFSTSSYRYPGNWQPAPRIEFTVTVDPSLTDPHHVRSVRGY